MLSGGMSAFVAKAAPALLAPAIAVLDDFAAANPQGP